MKKPFYMKRILVHTKELNPLCKKAAIWINKNFKGKNPLVVGVLNGCIFFYTHVLENVTIPVQTDFVKIQSNHSSNYVSKKPKIIYDTFYSPKNRHVLILEDICDSGWSLVSLKEYLKARGAKSVKICVLIDKPAGRMASIKLDYVCRTIPNAWIVGWGFDADNYLRNLPFIGELDSKYCKNIEPIKKQDFLYNKK